MHWEKNSYIASYANEQRKNVWDMSLKFVEQMNEMDWNEQHMNLRQKCTIPRYQMHLLMRPAENAAFSETSCILMHVPRFKMHEAL